MFNNIAIHTVNTIQEGKKKFVSTFVLHQGLAEACNQFIDSQTEYTKALIVNGNTALTSISKVVTRPEFMTESYELCATIGETLMKNLQPKKGEKNGRK